LKKLLIDGGPQFQVCAHGVSDVSGMQIGLSALRNNLKATICMKCDPHPLHGDRPRQMVVKTASALQKFLDRPTAASELQFVKTQLDARQAALAARQKEEEHHAAVTEQKRQMSEKVRKQKQQLRSTQQAAEQKRRDRQKMGLSSWNPDRKDEPEPAPQPAEQPAAMTHTNRADLLSSTSLFGDDNDDDSDDDYDPLGLFGQSSTQVTDNEAAELMADAGDNEDLQTVESDLFGGDVALASGGGAHSINHSLPSDDSDDKLFDKQRRPICSRRQQR